MRILFLTQYYPPETCAAPLRAYHFAKNLVRSGHDVTVVTGMPNHPSGVKPEGYRGRVWMREEADGVRILRSWLYSTPRKTFATRMANQLSFAFTSWFAGLSAGRCDIVLVTSPPLFLGVTGWLLALLRGVPYVIDVRDYWPHAAVTLGELRSRRVIALAEWLESFLYRRAAAVVAVTPGVVPLMVRRGVRRDRIVLITNGADTDCFRPETAGVSDDPPRGSNGALTVLYSGTHGLVHGMDVLLDAAEALRDRPEVRFVMIGDGVAKDGLVREAERRGLPNVDFRPTQTPRELARAIGHADVCVATTHEKGTLQGMGIPVKMFDYMACGRPIVAAVGGDARSVVEASGGGIVVRPGDGPALATALTRLLDDPGLREKLGQRGSEFVAREYSRRMLADRMRLVLVRAADDETDVGGGALGFRRYLSVKYVLDLFGAVILLALASPVYALVALAVRLDSPGPVIFRQRRIGVHSHEFMIWKFRTMKTDTPELATDLMEPMADAYTTRVGSFLRKTSLDELPNLVNVVRGEMSLVGPRPALFNQYELIEKRRLAKVDLLRPGVTGWAQVNGRDAIYLREKVRLDDFYLRHCSLGLDLTILLRTITAVVRAAGRTELPPLRRQVDAGGERTTHEEAG